MQMVIKGSHCGAADKFQKNNHTSSQASNHPTISNIHASIQSTKVQTMEFKCGAIF
jgi:hypothetical protein